MCVRTYILGSFASAWAEARRAINPKIAKRGEATFNEKILSVYKRQNVRYIDGFRGVKYPSCIW